MGFDLTAFEAWIFSREMSVGTVEVEEIMLVEFTYNCGGCFKDLVFVDFFGHWSRIVKANLFG
jgi:hypothetical protein